MSQVAPHLMAQAGGQSNVSASMVELNKSTIVDIKVDDIASRSRLICNKVEEECKSCLHCSVYMYLLKNLDT